MFEYSNNYVRVQSLLRSTTVRVKLNVANGMT